MKNVFAKRALGVLTCEEMWIKWSPANYEGHMKYESSKRIRP